MSSRRGGAGGQLGIEACHGLTEGNQACSRCGAPYPPPDARGGLSTYCREEVRLMEAIVVAGGRSASRRPAYVVAGWSQSGGLTAASSLITVR